MKKISPTLYLNDAEDLALVLTTTTKGAKVWIVISKETTKIVYGPDKYFSSAKLYLKIMNRKETYEVSKKSS